jgi:hypothetical protein
MYGVSTGDGKPQCMTWDAACHQMFYEFWEYDPAGECPHNGMQAGRQMAPTMARTMAAEGCTQTCQASSRPLLF